MKNCNRGFRSETIMIVTQRGKYNEKGNQMVLPLQLDL